MERQRVTLNAENHIQELPVLKKEGIVKVEVTADTGSEKTEPVVIAAALIKWYREQDDKEKLYLLAVNSLPGSTAVPALLRAVQDFAKRAGVKAVMADGAFCPANVLAAAGFRKDERTGDWIWRTDCRV